MGSVVLAKDVRLGREVAVKLLSPELARTDALRKRFLEEARAMGGLRNDHVAQVYSYGTHGDEPYIVMEYITGENVVDFLDSRRTMNRDVDEDTVLSIVDQIAKGLASIHLAGIIHGDIKPSNVIVGPRLRAVVVDFGLMRWLGDVEDTSIVVGTPAYIPPEVVRADSLDLKLTPAADVFALGVTAFEMLTGRLPFVVTNVDELFDVHLKNTQAPQLSSLRPDLPRSLDEVFERVLSGDLAERYRTADDFRRALSAARSDRHPDTRPLGILLADRDDEFRLGTAVALEDALPSTVVCTAEDAEGLVAIAEREPVDVVILDSELLPGRSVDVVRALKHSPKTARLPIVVVGDDVSGELWASLHAVGADACMPKPVDLPSLGAVAKALGTR